MKKEARPDFSFPDLELVETPHGILVRNPTEQGALPHVLGTSLVIDRDSRHNLMSRFQADLFLLRPAMQVAVHNVLAHINKYRKCTADRSVLQITQLALDVCARLYSVVQGSGFDKFGVHVDFNLTRPLTMEWTIKMPTNEEDTTPVLEPMELTSYDLSDLSIRRVLH